MSLFGNDYDYKKRLLFTTTYIEQVTLVDNDEPYGHIWRLFFLLLLYLITNFLERLNEVVVLGFACVVDDGDFLVVH